MVSDDLRRSTLNHRLVVGFETTDPQAAESVTEHETNSFFPQREVSREVLTA
jgi:hypothetical protein